MAHKILMLGGFRAGKSSILASILYSVKQVNKGIFSIVDKTDYTDAAGAPVNLDNKRMEVSQFIKKLDKVHGEDELFLVDMTPTQGKSTYTLTTRIDGAAGVDFDFVDVPGEWMKKTEPTYNELKRSIAECDVFIIAIDTPYMMQEDNDLNEKYNRIEEITTALDGIAADINMNYIECQKKMVLFCPVKCEKWIRAGKADVVSQKVRSSYRELINKFCNHKGIDMWIMPIQTVGAIEFAEMKDAYRYFPTSSEKEGIKCSYDELTGIVRLSDGKVVSDATEDQLEKDTKNDGVRDGFEIPWAWYKRNGVSKYEPVDCEQPAYHILRFLVKKESAVIQNKVSERSKESWFMKILRWFSDPPFGQYLDQYRKVVDSLEIKENGGGFMEIREKVV
ncbi:MAG: hypothetical protein MJZ86_09270 [Bacteroidales bacterium]|nr:hypothetical protein [Bacteroidales bacterium]